MQRDGAAQVPAPTVRARLAAAAVALSVERVEATGRPVAQAGAAAMARALAAVQVTREVTWRHCMATAQAAERVAPQLAGPGRAAPMAEMQAVQAAVAPEVERAPMG